MPKHLAIISMLAVLGGCASTEQELDRAMEKTAAALAYGHPELSEVPRDEQRRRAAECSYQVLENEDDPSYRSLLQCYRDKGWLTP